MMNEDYWGAIVERNNNIVSGYIVNLNQMTSDVPLEFVLRGEKFQTLMQDENSDIADSPYDDARFAFRLELGSETDFDSENLRIKVAGTDHVLKEFDNGARISGVTKVIGRSEIACHLICIDDGRKEIILNIMRGGSIFGAIVASLDKYPFLDHLHCSFRVNISDLLEENETSEHIQLYSPDFDYSLSPWGADDLSLITGKKILTEIILEKEDFEKIPNSEKRLVNDQTTDSPHLKDAEHIDEPENDNGSDNYKSKFEFFSDDSEIKAGIAFINGYLEGYFTCEQPSFGYKVSISELDNLIWRDYPRRLVESALISEGCGSAGFRIELPPLNIPVSKRRITISVESFTKYTFDYLFDASAQFVGEIVEISKAGTMLVVRGWCVDKARPSDPVSIQVKLGGVLLEKIDIDRKRAGVSYAGYDAPNADFIIQAVIPPDASLSSVTCHAAWCEEPLPITGADVATEPTIPEISKVEELQDILENISEDCDVIDGTIDEVSPRFIRGWARNRNDKSAPIILDCIIDNVIFATGTPSRFRADLQKKFNDHGFHEFIFEMNPVIFWQRPGQIEIRPRRGESRINLKINRLPHRILLSRIISPTRSKIPEKFLAAKSLNAKDKSVAYIIINRNGSSLLKRFMNAFKLHENYKNVEIIVVDHNSNDDTADEIQKWTNLVNIKFLKRDGNYSFSASNNFAATHTSAEILIFINNDVFLTEPLAAHLASRLNDERIGCVGIRLLDDIPNGQDIEQSAIQHLGIHFRSDDTSSLLAPYESRYNSLWEGQDKISVHVPAVTGACLACRRSDFVRFGGFDERYFYGMEDVDLCMKFLKAGLEVICSNDLAAQHLRGYSRATMNKIHNHARVRNKFILEDNFGFWWRTKTARDRFNRAGYWTSNLPRIAFAVTEATSNTLAGDYFTALELASQLSARFPVQCIFLEYSQNNQYDLRDCDVLIAMRDDYDTSKIVNASPHLIKISWVRNWFQRFSERKHADAFDFIWASSQSACQFISKKLHKKVELIPIATNLYRFEAGKTSSDYASDYCFTGSYWGLNREIVQMLQPQRLPFRFALFGTGWEVHPELSAFHKGSLPYREMPNVYASSKLVIDDANHVTKSWGGVNSRVFDAIAAGCVVLTNSTVGSRDSFDGKLPVYRTAQELESLIFFYLNDENARVNKVEELKSIVKSRHTYQIRATQIWKILETSYSQMRVSIKIGAPTAQGIEAWGDYHFAKAIKRRFDALGHTVRIDPIESWNCAAAAGDNVVIVLRGLTSYQTKSHQINIMWNISHFEKISISEFNSYDHVFLASKMAVDIVKDKLDVDCSSLLQCTDSELFNFQGVNEDYRHNILFVGNSRGVYRPVVRTVVEGQHDIAIYGGGWEAFVPDSIIKGQYVDNEKLANYYSSSHVVLNDHWDSMRKYGFISNRIFDAVASGALVISDYVNGLEEIFGDAVLFYRDPSEIPSLLEKTKAIGNNFAKRKEISEKILKDHTFDVRFNDILGKINWLIQKKMN